MEQNNLFLINRPINPQTNKVKKIKNVLYRQFLDEGLIQTINEEEFFELLKGVNGKRGQAQLEARSMLITMFYTGARPVTVLKMKGEDFKIEDSYLVVTVKPAKRGIPATIYLPRSKKLISELCRYVFSQPPSNYLFASYATKYMRIKKLPNGQVRYTPNISDGLRWYFKKWFKTKLIIPYFLRHNRFSRLSQNGVSMDEIRLLKGARSYSSVTYYLHLSTLTAKKAAKKFN